MNKLLQADSIVDKVPAAEVDSKFPDMNYQQQSRDGN